MSKLAAYSSKYRNLGFSRQDGVLLVTLGTNGGPLVWSESAHRELPEAFADIAGDAENRVVILTATGDAWCTRSDKAGWEQLGTAEGWDQIFREGRRLLSNFLDIEAPVIAAVNGPASRYAALPVICDLVLAVESASFQDATHVVVGTVPGDGSHVVWPQVLGWSRSRYFLWTGQVVTARDALALGVVHELFADVEPMMERAQALAKQLAANRPMLLRNTRLALNYELRHKLRAALEHGLALEGLAYIDRASAER